MKLVKTKPKYRCDFCKLTGTKYWMEKHEKQCYRNPKRICSACNNTKQIEIDDFDGITGDSFHHPIMGDCPYCSKFDKEMLREIEKREEETNTVKENVEPKDLPF